MADNIIGGWNASMFTIAGVTLIAGGSGCSVYCYLRGDGSGKDIGIRNGTGRRPMAHSGLFLAESLHWRFWGR